MRREIAASPVVSQFFQGGATTFVFKGTNGRWRQTLLDDDLAMYERAAAGLDPALREWLEHGTPATTT